MVRCGEQRGSDCSLPLSCSDRCLWPMPCAKLLQNRTVWKCCISRAQCSGRAKRGERRSAVTGIYSPSSGKCSTLSFLILFLCHRTFLIRNRLVSVELNLLSDEALQSYLESLVIKMEEFVQNQKLGFVGAVSLHGLLQTCLTSLKVCGGRS